MPPKRQSFLDKLEQERPSAPETVQATVAASKEARAVTPLTRPGVTKTSIYIPDAVHERLREIAFTERRKLHDLLMEGLDRVMESRGHPERTSDGKTS